MKVTTSEITKADRDQMEEEIISYIGDKRYQALKNLSPKDQRILASSLHGNIEGTYLVEGAKDDLTKFKNYFLSRCSIIRPAFSQYMLSDYIEGGLNRNEDPISRLETELLFIRCHREATGIGHTEQWMEGSLLNNLCNRNRKGLITVILTERELPIIQASKEVTYVNLVKAFRTARVKTYVEKDSGAKTESKGTEGYAPSY